MAEPTLEALEVSRGSKASGHEPPWRGSNRHLLCWQAGSSPLLPPGKPVYERNCVWVRVGCACRVCMSIGHAGNFENSSGSETPRGLGLRRPRKQGVTAWESWWGSWQRAKQTFSQGHSGCVLGEKTLWTETDEKQSLHFSSVMSSAEVTPEETLQRSCLLSPSRCLHLIFCT